MTEKENTIEKILTFIEAEAWGYIDYLRKKERISGDLGDHISILVGNIKDRLREELPEILSDEYEKAFMDGFESHPSHKYLTDLLDVFGHGTTYTSEEIQKIIKEFRK